MNSLEKNKLYKEKEKKKKQIDKVASDCEKKLEQRKKKIQEQYLSLKEKSIARISLQYDKKLEKRLKKISSQYEEMRKTKKARIKGQSRKKKPEKKSKWIKEAKKRFCLYCKLSRARQDGMVWVLDAQRWMHWKDTNAGHYYPFHDYPQLGFEQDNCRPITKWMNKRQGDNIGTLWEDQRKSELSIEDVIRIENLAKDKQAKNELRDTNYFMSEAKEWKRLCMIEAERLEITL